MAGDTVFEAASISKVIAAYAALVLVERGVLSLDEPVHHYLSQPWLPPSTYAEQITLRHLLTHTSGLTNQVNPVDKSIVFPPGERYEYSGVGFMYLQEVMEQVTGKSLEQIAQELVFEPLEMDSSSYVNSYEYDAQACLWSYQLRLYFASGASAGAGIRFDPPGGLNHPANSIGKVYSHR